MVHGSVCRDVACGDDRQRFSAFCQQRLPFYQDAIVINARIGVCRFHIQISVGMVRLFYAAHEKPAANSGLRVYTYRFIHTPERS